MPEGLAVYWRSSAAAFVEVTANLAPWASSPAAFLGTAVALFPIVSHALCKSMSTKGVSHEHSYLFEPVVPIRRRRAECHEYTCSRPGGME